MYDPNGQGLFGQSQMRKSMGVKTQEAVPGQMDSPMGGGNQGRGVMGGGGMIEPKRVTQDNGPNPIRREWNGWQEQPGPEGPPFGGAGGPMPIPDGGPNWKGFGQTDGYTGYKDNTQWINGNPVRLDMPPPNWNNGQTGGLDPVTLGGGLGGPQMEGGPYGGAGGPMPQRPIMPPGAVPMDRAPGMNPAWYLQNHPNNPNSLFARWKASQQQGNTGIVPPHLQDGGGRILGGPGSPPHAQGGTNIDPQLLQYLANRRG